MHSNPVPYTEYDVLVALTENEDASFHELITRSDVRLFMDVDHSTTPPIIMIERVCKVIDSMKIFD